MERLLITPEGALQYDPTNLGLALNRLAAATAREPEAAPGYPRVMARNNRWCRQNIPGGEWWPIPHDEARELFGAEVA